MEFIQPIKKREEKFQFQMTALNGGIGHNLFLFLLNLEIKKIFLFRFIENDRFSEMPFNCFGMDAEYQ